MRYKKQWEECRLEYPQYAIGTRQGEAHFVHLPSYPDRIEWRAQSAKIEEICQGLNNKKGEEEMKTNKKLEQAREYAQRLHNAHRNVVYDAETRKSINRQVHEAYLEVFNSAGKELSLLSDAERYQLQDEYGQYPSGAIYKGGAVKNDYDIKEVEEEHGLSI